MVCILPKKNGILIKDGDNIYNIPRPIHSLKSIRNIKNRSIVVGYVGANGSGKSVNAAREIILDYMLHGKPAIDGLARKQLVEALNTFRWLEPNKNTKETKDKQKIQS